MRVLKIVALVSVLGLTGSALAQQINDPNQITLRHDFETQPPSAPPPGPFTLGDATFSEQSSGSGGPGWRLLPGIWPGFGRILTDNAGISDITITFSQPMLKAGLNVGVGRSQGTTYRVDFLSGQNVIGTVSGTVRSDPENFFAGWQHGAGITSIHITEPSGENFAVGGMDNVRYDVIPEPSTLAMLGLIGLAGLRRR